MRFKFDIKSERLKSCHMLLLTLYASRLLYKYIYYINLLLWYNDIAVFLVVVCILNEIV